MFTKVILLIMLAVGVLGTDFLIPTLLNQKIEHEKPDLKKLHGRIKINGEFWETDCSCSKKDTQMQGRSCNPNKIKEFMDKKGLGLNAVQIKDFFGDVKKLDWVKISTASFSCVDGRRKDNDLSKHTVNQRHPWGRRRGVPVGRAHILKLLLSEDEVGLPENTCDVSEVLGFHGCPSVHYVHRRHSYSTYCHPVVCTIQSHID
jgi:hypothetical protein